MRKSITPVVAIVLLISMTVFAAAMSYFWINSVQSSLMEKVGSSTENAPGSDCTRLHLISIKGDSAVVKNVGCDNVTEFNMLINGRLRKYTLDEPLAPGESTIVTYSPQTAGEDLTVEIVGSWGTTSLTSPAEENTEEAGFVDRALHFYIRNVGLSRANAVFSGLCNAYADYSNYLLGYSYKWYVDGVEQYSNYYYKDTYLYLGDSQTCGILTNGSAMCWGSDADGEVGNGPGINNGPSIVVGGYEYSIIGVGRYHSCGILTNGSALCWGWNYNGQLGDGTTTSRDSPTFVNTNEQFMQIGGGYRFTCGLTYKGKVMCWGNNDYGQLGDGSITQRITPDYISSDKRFIYLTSGDAFSCGLIRNGSAMCWGNNNYGQLGNGSAGGYSKVPVFVSEGNKFSEVVATGSHACGLLLNGSALCWGANSNGQLGDNSTTDRSSPVFVSGDYEFLQISTGAAHSCGLLTNSSVVCWGSNSNGQLGNGSAGGYSTTPIFVEGNYTFSLVKCGYSHTCGILTNGTMLCWGKNSNAQLGDGSSTDKSRPTFVDTDKSFLRNSDSWNSNEIVNRFYLYPYPDSYYTPQGTNITFVCSSTRIVNSTKSLETSVAVNYGGTVFAYDASIVEFSGGLRGYCNASGTNEEDLMKYKYSWKKNNNLLFINIYYPVKHIGVDSSSSRAILFNNSVVSWGVNSYGQLGNGSVGGYSTVPVFLNSSYEFAQVSGGNNFACGILTNGSAMCWGDNGGGKLGNGSSGGNSAVPVFVDGGYNFSTISCFDSHSCGVLDNGSAVCWGDNSDGQLGDGTTTPKYSPIFVSGDYNWSKISVGIYHSCGLLVNGSALCWGGNYNGQLGDGTTTSSSVPVFVDGDYNFSQIFVGGQHSCGILTNGSALCWGLNDYGQLGDGTTTLRTSPRFVSGNYEFSNLVSGDRYSCGVLTNGSALCWGANSYGRLGDGTTDNRVVPTFVSGGHIFSTIDVGYHHTCGILTNGSALCWGYNAYGRLGDGTTTNRYTPTLVSGDYSFINNSYYWNKDTLVSILPSSYYSSGDTITFECSVLNDEDESNVESASKTI